MKTTDSQFEEVWERTLPRIRSARRKRQFCRGALAATAVFGALAATWLTSQPEKPAYRPVVKAEPDPPTFDTIVVIRINDDGTIRLEELASSELGQTELVFGQTPVVAYDFQEL